MYYFYFDSGTTNTRAYLIHNQQIIQHAEIPIGSRDSALNHDKTVLVMALKQLYDKIMCEAGICEEDIMEIYMSGMISCPSGLIEIEHLSAPVNFQKLKDGIIVYLETEFFKREIHIVPGIKTLPQGTTASIETVVSANNMRGEEIELLGILHRCPELATGNSIIVLPGSHTQVAFLYNGEIKNISSNITGELYHAIISQTILSSSLEGETETAIQPQMVCMGYQIAHQYGFNRALYVVRSMDLFADSSLEQRRSYLEGVLNGGVMDAIAQVMKEESGTIAIAGSCKQYEIFSAFSYKLFPQFKIMKVPNTSDFPFSVEGFLSLIESNTP